VPNHPAALYNLGVLYMDFKKDKARAKEMFAKYVDVAPSKDPKRADAQTRMKELK